jgi:fucose 4-O-acetylase-like acetyltransferase
LVVMLVVVVVVVVVVMLMLMMSSRRRWTAVVSQTSPICAWIGESTLFSLIASDDVCWQSFFDSLLSVI